MSRMIGLPLKTSGLAVILLRKSSLAVSVLRYF